MWLLRYTPRRVPSASKTATELKNTLLPRSKKLTGRTCAAAGGGGCFMHHTLRRGSRDVGVLMYVQATSIWSRRKSQVFRPPRDKGGENMNEIGCGLIRWEAELG